jgi:molybdopterin-guanine dinucleotide biosynthesis protein A
VRIAGFAVAGGGSRRMGRDKALLPWGETDLLGHTLARLRAVCDDVRILCGPRARYEGRGVIVPDGLAGEGPAAGLLAALEVAAGEPALLLAVDLPLVPVALLAALTARAGDGDAVVPVLQDGPEPLCAVYGRACLGPLRQRLAQRELRMTSFWPEVTVCEVGPDAVRRFGSPDLVFLNANDADDYRRALEARSPAPPVKER